MGKPGYLRFIYNHNPFYLISACFILYGLQTTNSAEPDNLWFLAAILIGYSIVLSATSILIIKLGQVWDDARSIFMVLLLIFFSISISFDRLCITNSQLATQVLTIGFLFCFLTSETIIRSLEIKFPISFRIPYYLIFLLIFGYPLLFSAKQTWFSYIDDHWLMLAFPVVASAILLGLIPAVRAGQTRLAKNGTPWNWPMYPWSLYFMLIIGICFRSAVLCISFESKFGFQSIFGPYFLIPIVLAVSILLLESFSVERKPALRIAGLALPWICIPLAFSWYSNPIFDAGVNRLTLSLGSPIWITAMALMGYYLVAWIRHIDCGGKWFNAATCFAVFASPAANELSFSMFSFWPVCVLALVNFAIGLIRKETTRLVIANLCLAIATVLFVSQYQHPLMGALAGFHVLLVGSLMIGSLNDDRLARQLNAICAIVIPMAGIAALLAGLLNVAPIDYVCIEILILAIAALIANLTKLDPLLRYSGYLTLYLFIPLVLRYASSYLESSDQQKLYQYLLLGSSFFVVGLFISLLKSGLSSMFVLRWQNYRDEFSSRFILIEKPVESPEAI